MFELKHHTGQDWVDAVMADFNRFLQDHAAAEKKASGMAIAMLSHYPDKAKLVRTMTDLAIEELIHFKQVLKLLVARDVTLGQDKKTPTLPRFVPYFVTVPAFLMDRLLVAAVIEARGYEKFWLVSQALPEGKDKELYVAIAKSEEKHKNLFVELAYEYCEKSEVDQRLEEILIAEAEICAGLPIRAVLH